MRGVLDNNVFDFLEKTWIKVARKSGLKFHSNSYCQGTEKEEKKHNSINELMQPSSMTR
jgi:hypothetical protein